MIQEFIFKWCGGNYTQIVVNHDNKTFAVYDELTDSQKVIFNYLQDYFNKPIMRCPLRQSETAEAVETLTANGYTQVDTMDNFTEVIGNIYDNAELLEVTEEEYAKYLKKTQELNAVGAEITPFVKCEIRYGYAHYTFSCEINQPFIDALKQKFNRGLDCEDIIILVDGSFSHFGASCTGSGNCYVGKVYTD